MSTFFVRYAFGTPMLSFGLIGATFFAENSVLLAPITSRARDGMVRNESAEMNSAKFATDPLKKPIAQRRRKLVYLSIRASSIIINAKTADTASIILRVR